MNENWIYKPKNCASLANIFITFNFNTQIYIIYLLPKLGHPTVCTQIPQNHNISGMCHSKILSSVEVFRSVKDYFVEMKW